MWKDCCMVEIRHFNGNYCFFLSRFVPTKNNQTKQGIGEDFNVYLLLSSKEIQHFTEESLLMQRNYTIFHRSFLNFHKLRVHARVYVDATQSLGSRQQPCIAQCHYRELGGHWCLDLCRDGVRVDTLHVGYPIVSAAWSRLFPNRGIKWDASTPCPIAISAILDHVAGQADIAGLDHRFYINDSYCFKLRIIQYVHLFRERFYLKHLL